MQCISAYFPREHLPKKTTTILLWDPKGSAWEVTFILNKCRSYLSRGWAAFSIGNNLKEGDVCIFEVVDECQMQVLIFPSKTSPSTIKTSEETKPLNRASHIWFFSSATALALDWFGFCWRWHGNLFGNYFCNISMDFVLFKDTTFGTSQKVSIN